MSTYYTSQFFRDLDFHSLQSANEIVPILYDLLKPESVIDIGCGTGVWLSVFQDLGVDDVFGVDGPWVPRALLKLPQEKFVEHDLTTPLCLDRRFDLAMSLEVAEHLPEATGKRFVELLTGLAPIVVFSAAIPFQGGNHHINEQWQSYWANIFRERDYVPLDCIRPVIWDNSSISVFYRQNLLVYLDRDYIARTPHLQEIYQQFAARQISIVHPEYLNSMGVGTLLKLLPQAFIRSLRARTKRIV